MITEEGAHEHADRIGVIVFAKLLDACGLKHLLSVDVVRLKTRLLQNVHQDLERLIHLPADTIEDISKEVGLVHNLQTCARILQSSGNIRRIEALRPAYS